MRDELMNVGGVHSFYLKRRLTTEDAEDAEEKQILEICMIQVVL